MAARRAQSASASIVSSTFRSLIIALATVIIARPAHAAVFAYQGALRSGGTPLNGTVDLRFRLYGVPAGGLPIGSVPVNAVSVVDGLFTAEIDFGSAVFTGADRWIEIDVANPANGGAGPFTTLTPRQRVGFAPMAQHALNASLSGTYASAVNFSSAANSFTGSGAGLTNLNAANLAGTIGSTLLSGSYANALTLSNASNAISGTFSGNGSGLSSLNAANIGSGNLAAARLPSSGIWTLSDLLRIDSSTLCVDPLNNRVGIGVITPTHDLDVNGNMSVDGTTLNVDDVNNRVGVGTSLPQSRFHVVGSTRLEGQMTFDGTATFVSVPTLPSTTRYHAIPPVAFQPSRGGDFVATIVNYGLDSGSYVCSAPIHVPHGATITNVAVTVFDDSLAENMSVYLDHLNLITGVSGVEGTANTGGAQSTLRIINFPLSVVANNNSSSLMIRCQWTVPSPAWDMYVVGARVTYTIDEPLP